MEFPKMDPMYIQIMTEEQTEEFKWNPFDITKVWFQRRVSIDRSWGNGTQ